jgi:hypothetical protein
MRHTEYANKEMTINSNSQLNDADLELLSAYIDSQLGDSERAALERRLAQEPVLRGVLDELRATVGLLHDLEPLRPPRSFMLVVPATAPRRFWRFQWPAIASALVALVCLLTFSYALIRSSGGGSTASAPAPAALQEATAPTAAAAGAAAPDSAMRQSPAMTAAPAAAAPTGAPAEAPAAPMAAAEAATAAEEATAAPAAAAPTAAPAEESTAGPAAAAPTAAPAEESTAAPMTAAEASTPSPAIMASGGAGAIATAQPAAEAPAADSAAPTTVAPPADMARTATSATALQPYTALVATAEISPPSTVTLEQPPIAPVANSAPSGGSRNLWLIAGVVVLALLIAAGIGLALRRKL